MAGIYGGQQGQQRTAAEGGLSVEIKDWVQLVGLLVAIGALIFTAYSVDRNRRTVRAQFWLNLRDQFSKHLEVHLKLRPGGEWAGTGKGPSSAQEWAQLEAYMGLFELCEIMLREGLIDLKTFSLIYGYRVRNILANEVIVQEKLLKAKEGWTQFINLTRRLGLKSPGAGT
jgi:hypothetical protein